jgi:hypothetical protein
VPFLAASEAPPSPESAKFPVFSQLAGNSTVQETGSLETASSSSESDELPTQPWRSIIALASAVVLASFGGDLRASSVLIDRGLELNPSFALGWFRSGVIRLFDGQPSVAISKMDGRASLSGQGNNMSTPPPNMINATTDCT